MRKFRKFYNFEKLSNTLSIKVILKNNNKIKFNYKIIVLWRYVDVNNRTQYRVHFNYDIFIVIIQ